MMLSSMSATALRDEAALSGPQASAGSMALADIRAGTYPGLALPWLIEPATDALRRDPRSVAAWCRAHAQPLALLLQQRGCLLLRGFAVIETRDFGEMSAIFPPHGGGYLGGATPRSAIQGQVFEATRVASPFKILLHQEMSYLPHRPARLMFYCRVPAQTGGETIVADMRRVTRLLPEEVHAAFEGRRIRYLRNLAHHGASERQGGGIQAWMSDFHRSWRDSFATEDQGEVEQACRNMGLPFHWETDGSLSIVYEAPAYHVHPATGDRVWFNHVATLHNNPRSMGRASSLLSLYERAGRHLPHRLSFDDGEPLPVPLVEKILDTLDTATEAFPWQAGDVMLLDNVLVAHGRNPFSGPRDVQVTLHD